MADPWAEFRAPEANAGALIRNDAPAIDAGRIPVPSTNRTWGDAEAVKAGLYEPQGDQWAEFRAAPQAAQAAQAAPQVAQQPPATFDQRFSGEPTTPAIPEGLQSALLAKADQMTTGPATSPMQQASAEMNNLVPAASQGTDPNAARYSGKLISKETFQSDSGEVLYRDPATGAVKPTDSKTQVAIRDPRDNTVKIFERSEATNEGPAVGVARVLAPGLAAGAPTARPALAAVNEAKIVPKASEIFGTAKPFYRAFKNEAGKIEIPAEGATAISERLKASLNKANLIPELAQPVYSAVGILDKGEPITLDALQNVKRVVGRSFNSPDKNVRDAAAVVSGEIGKVIGEASKTAAANLKTGDDIYSTARAVQDLQRKSGVADLRAGRAGYGGNAVNSMRQVLSPIVQRSIEGKTTGFKPNEIQAMRDIVEGTAATNALRGVGQLSPSKGIIQTVGAGGAAVAMGPTALAIPALGMASNKLATVLTGKQIERLQELVAKRSPAYAAAVAKAVEKHDAAMSALATNPTPAKFAAYLSASRALSSGLQRDGIQITSGDFIRLLQSPAKSAADAEQQPEPGLPSQ